MQSRGFIYATTGKDYTVLARRSARNLRAVMPNVSVDLFTDQDVDDPVFDRVHRLHQSSHRPKMEAMLRSRFDRNVLLDADTIPVGDVTDLFDLLDHCHIAGALAYARPPWAVDAQRHIPRSFPYINGGVLAFRRSPRMMRLITEWQNIVVGKNLRHDQPSLRALIYRYKMPMMVLPHYYNLFYVRTLDRWEDNFGPPLILHVFELHKSPPGNPETPFDLVAALGRSRASVVSAFLKKARLQAEGSAKPGVSLQAGQPVATVETSFIGRAHRWLRRRARRLRL